MSGSVRGVWRNVLGECEKCGGEELGECGEMCLVSVGKV